MRLELKILLVSLFANSISASSQPAVMSSSSHHNESENRVIRRQKRFFPLVFPGGGTAKFVTGYLGPIDTPLFINCNAIRNFQFQYPTPDNWQWNPIHWPGLAQTGFQRSFHDERQQTKPQPDSSRRIAYDIVEDVLTREGKNGRACMLRAICEVAESPVNHDGNGIIGELVQLFFTPGEHELIDEDYRDAQSAGRNRVNCERMYEHCPMGHGILDSISLIRDLGLPNF